MTGTTNRRRPEWLRGGIAALTLLGALMPLSTAHAQTAPTQVRDDDDDDDAPVPAGAIVVTARALDAARARVAPNLGATAYTLSNDAVEKRPGGESANLVNVMLQMPGVAQGPDGAIRVRGQGQLQYRIDNIILPAGLTDPADTLRARFADKIELITGALPAQYGLLTGGVVNITTKSGAYEHGGEVELYGGTQGRFEPAFELAGARGPTNWYVSGSYLRSDAGLPAPDAASVPRHDHTDQGDALAYIDRILDAHSRLALILGISHDALQVPQAATTPWGDAQSRASQYAMLAWQRSGAALSWQIATFLSHGVDRLDPDVPADVAIAGIADHDRTEALSTGVQAEAVLALGEAHQARAGLLETWRQTRDRARDTTPTGLLATQSLTARSETGVYIEDAWQITAPLTLNYGLRFDRVSGAGGGGAVSPRANLVWTTGDGATVHLGYARYFVPAPPADAGATMARAEHDDDIDIGITRSHDGLMLGLDGYWRGSRDLLDTALSADGRVARAFNFAHATSIGIEASATWYAGPFAAWANVALAHSTGRGIGGGAFTAAQIAAATRDLATNSDQRVTGAAGIAWHTGPLRLSGDATWGSGLPRTDLTAADAWVNGARLPAWARINLAAVWRARGLAGRPLDLRIDAMNALDAARLVQDGTSLAGGLPQWAARRGVFVGIEQTL